MRFITDITLGTLARWLRILGYDTVFHRLPLDRSMVRRAVAEDRFLLTRRRNLPKWAHPGRVFSIRSDRVEGQLREMTEILPLVLQEERFCTRCSICNTALTPSGKKDVAGSVPDFVLAGEERFMTCSSCGRVYWPGTHRDRMYDFLRSRIHSRHL